MKFLKMVQYRLTSGLKIMSGQMTKMMSSDFLRSTQVKTSSGASGSGVKAMILF